ncbi:MAG: TRAP transporter substrate-binding protein DctP [Candidatus Marinimicrobia bacterium]|nr:TRAP transporter substrate-binding protein DctP [Candidatus Neomarinimicrobiota bacterium]
MRKFIFILLLNFCFLFAQEYTIKMATVAPEGSFWMKEMNRVEKNVADKTDGMIDFKIYTSGVQGDEIEMLRKMKLKQLDAASFTGVGLGKIVPDIRVLEVPFLFRNHAEIDYVKDKLFDYFQEKFEEKGFYMTAWAEVGFVYLFTKDKVRTKKDISKVKMWLWKGDPLAKTVFNILDISAVPLAINDVYTSLQTGLIDGVYISPYGAMALQWFTKTNYIMDYPLTYSIGAVLINKEKLLSIPEKERQILINETQESMQEIVKKSREDNRETLKILQDNCLELVDITPEAEKLYKDAGIETRQKLAGNLYSKEIMNRVLNLLEEYRSSTSE